MSEKIMVNKPNKQWCCSHPNVCIYVGIHFLFNRFYFSYCPKLV